MAELIELFAAIITLIAATFALVAVYNWRKRYHEQKRLEAADFAMTTYCQVLDSLQHIEDHLGTCIEVLSKNEDKNRHSYVKTSSAMIEEADSIRKQYAGLHSTLKLIRGKTIPFFGMEISENTQPLVNTLKDFESCLAATKYYHATMKEISLENLVACDGGGALYRQMITLRDMIDISKKNKNSADINPVVDGFGFILKLYYRESERPNFHWWGYAKVSFIYIEYFLAWITRTYNRLDDPVKCSVCGNMIKGE